MQVASYQNRNFVLSTLQELVFFGYKELSLELIKKRMQILENKGAKKLEGLDIEAYFLPANTEKAHIIVFAHTHNLWQLHPRNYDHLKDHADVILWNPSKLTTLQYKKDLQSVIEKVRSSYPNKTITIIGRCATVDPAIAVAKDLGDKKINLVLDRGHGNIKNLARSLTFISSLPIIQEILLTQFDCKGEEKIPDVPGKIFFTRSQHDQLMKWGELNLTSNLIQKRGSHKEDQILDLPNSDHWSPWTQETHQRIYEFIGFKHIDVSSFPKNPIQSSFFARSLLPILTKGWF